MGNKIEDFSYYEHSKGLRSENGAMIFVLHKRLLNALLSSVGHEHRNKIIESLKDQNIQVERADAHLLRTDRVYTPVPMPLEGLSSELGSYDKMPLSFQDFARITEADPRILKIMQNLVRDPGDGLMLRLNISNDGKLVSIMGIAPLDRKLHSLGDEISEDIVVVSPSKLLVGNVSKSPGYKARLDMVNLTTLAISRAYFNAHKSRSGVLNPLEDVVAIQTAIPGHSIEDGMFPIIFDTPHISDKDKREMINMLNRAITEERLG